jgi:cystathionine beta-synthase
MGGKLDAVVAGVGSGGTITGMAEFFKEKDPKIQMVVADPERSIVADAVLKGSFSYEGGSWLVEGVGEDFIPDNLNVALLHDAEVVSDKEAFQTLQVLIKEEGVLGGSSTGTLVAGAVKWCQKQTTPKRVVTFICDTGNKYLSKAFNKSWLLDNQLMDNASAGDLADLVNCCADKGDAISVTPTDTLMTAYKRMRSSDISQIPVIDEGELVGLLDEEDLLFNVSKSKEAFGRTIKEFMVTDLNILPADASEEALMKVLTQGKVAIICKGNCFIGFVTKVDLINHYRTQISQD